MAWLAVDKDGTEFIFEESPYREEEQWVDDYENVVQLPPGTIKRLIGKELTWYDEPVELGKRSVK